MTDTAASASAIILHRRGNVLMSLNMIHCNFIRVLWQPRGEREAVAKSLITSIRLSSPTHEVARVTCSHVLRL
jgi:hypothetical protein